jgi:hypothetical protein
LDKLFGSMSILSAHLHAVVLFTIAVYPICDRRAVFANDSYCEARRASNITSALATPGVIHPYTASPDGADASVLVPATQSITCCFAKRPMACIDMAVPLLLFAEPL